MVSVAMLTEGWDANNVTHILGLRAFGSQLLCEQVVGRGLRRMNYTPDPETELLPEEVDFTTRREVHSAQRSHLNAVVLDSQWEQTAAFYLEQQTDLVQAYARNERPFLLIPYEYEGVQHHYEPDYVVRLLNGTTLVLEVKGEKGDDDRAKHQAARRWVDAVNNWGRLGRWDFLECLAPHLVPQRLRAVVKKEQE